MDGPTKQGVESRSTRLKTQILDRNRPSTFNIDKNLHILTYKQPIVDFFTCVHPTYVYGILVAHARGAYSCELHHRLKLDLSDCTRFQ